MNSVCSSPKWVCRESSIVVRKSHQFTSNPRQSHQGRKRNGTITVCRGCVGRECLKNGWRELAEPHYSCTTIEICCEIMECLFRPPQTNTPKSGLINMT